MSARSAATLVAACLFFSAPGAVSAQDAIEAQPSEAARLSARSLLLDIARFEDRFIAVGDRGHILLSEDGGQVWRQVISPVRSMLTAVALVDDRHAWTVGHDGAILASSDGGANWQIQRWAPEDQTPLLDLWFENLEHGIATGAYGLTLETFDGGETWADRLLTEEDPHLNGIAGGTPGRVYVAGEFGTLLGSLDSGATFEPLASPYEGTFFGFFALSKDRLLAFGLRGNLFRSDDGGASWIRIDIGSTASIFAVARLADGRVVATGTDGLVLMSDDDGASFRAIARKDRRGVPALVETADGALLTVGEAGLVRIPDIEDPNSSEAIQASMPGHTP